MASVYNLKGTSFPSFQIGKNGPIMSSTGVLDLTLSAVSSNSIGVGGGAININGATNTTINGTGGAINITAGAASTTTGVGGIVSVSGGVGSLLSTTSHGGSVSIVGGQAGGTGGSVSLSSGSGVNSGTISITGGNSSGVGSSGSHVTLNAGNGVAVGGNIRLNAGTNTGAGITGSVIIGPTGTTTGLTGAIHFEELAATGTNYVGFKAPDSLITDTVWTLPSADGISGQTLATNGVGITYWQSPPVPYEIYASTTIFINNTIKVIPLNTIRLANADFTTTLSVITFNKAGNYVVDYTVAARSTNTTRGTVMWQLYVNGIVYPASAVYTYHRTTTNGKTSASRSVLISAIIGTTVELRCNKIGGNGLRSVANDCSMLIRGV